MPATITEVTYLTNESGIGPTDEIMFTFAGGGWVIWSDEHGDGLKGLADFLADVLTD